jgi:glycosyltransferase involved in cell wall biosynthesis
MGLIDKSRKILIYVDTKQKLEKSNKLGGIEILNYNLFNYLKLKYLIILTNKITNTIKRTKWDIAISSNDSSIFNSINADKKILWLHNLLQIEKAFRKKNLYPLFLNKPIAVFVSSYLESKTSKLYPFKKRIVIENFLDKNFENIKPNFIRKQIFIWSVQRSKGLENVLDLWQNTIIKEFPKARLYIFGIKKDKKWKKLKKFNIHFFGRVEKKILIENYRSSLGMICLGYDETFCLNAIESMSCGQPVISFGKTALKNLIIHNKNGYLVNDFDELTKRLLIILKSNKEKHAKIIKSTMLFSNRFYFKNIKKQWISLLKN